jgi:hypothetical protein
MKDTAAESNIKHTEINYKQLPELIAKLNSKAMILSDVISNMKNIQLSSDDIKKFVIQLCKIWKERCDERVSDTKKKYQSQTESMRSHLNVGFGNDITICELAMKIKAVIGFTGGIVFDSKKPDGSPQKLMDSASSNKLGWHAKTNLELGLHKTYQDFLLQCT